MNNYAAIDGDLADIAELIRGTNNGKIMIDRIPYPLRREVPRLVAAGCLIPATFMAPRDSVRLNGEVRNGQ